MIPLTENVPPQHEPVAEVVKTIWSQKSQKPFLITPLLGFKVSLMERQKICPTGVFSSCPLPGSYWQDQRYAMVTEEQFTFTQNQQNTKTVTVKVVRQWEQTQSSISYNKSFPDTVCFKLSASAVTWIKSFKWWTGFVKAIFLDNRLIEVLPTELWRFKKKKRHQEWKIDRIIMCQL